MLEIWQYMQDELVRVIAPLRDEQMKAGIAPDLRTVGELAEHIVRGRALWVHEVLGDPPLEPMINWDEPDTPPAQPLRWWPGSSTPGRFCVPT